MLGYRRQLTRIVAPAISRLGAQLEIVPTTKRCPTGMARTSCFREARHEKCDHVDGRRAAARSARCKPRRRARACRDFVADAASTRGVQGSASLTEEATQTADWRRWSAFFAGPKWRCLRERTHAERRRAQCSPLGCSSTANVLLYTRDSVADADKAQNGSPWLGLAQRNSNVACTNLQVLNEVTNVMLRKRA